MRYEQMLTHNSIHFQVGKCVTWQTENKLNISDAIQPIFIMLLQNDHTGSGHLIFVRNDVENVGQGQNLQK